MKKTVTVSEKHVNGRRNEEITCQKELLMKIEKEQAQSIKSKFLLFKALQYPQ